MDILRVLSSPDLEVRRKTLSLVLQLSSTRNIEQVVMVMKKELTGTMEATSDSNDIKSYRQVSTLCYRMVGNFRGVQNFVDFVCSAYPLNFSCITK